MARIKEINEDAFNYLDEIPVEKWTLAHDGGHRYGQITTNISEVFNSVIKGARSLPITASVERIFFKLVEYFCKRLLQGEKAVSQGLQFSPLVLTTVSRYEMKASTHVSSIYNWQLGRVGVTTKNGNTYVVNMTDCTCSCGKWKAFGIPCSHVYAACTKMSINYYRHISPYFSISSYVATYKPQLYPLDHKEYWPSVVKPTLRPNSDLQRTKGRPHTKRLQNEMDKRRTINCSHCKLAGHDIRTCPSMPTGGRGRGRGRRRSRGSGLGRGRDTPPVN